MPLNQQRDNQHLQFGHAAAPRQVTKGDILRQAEILLLKAPGKLVGNGRLEIVRDRLKRPRHRLAGPDGAAHHLERVGKLTSQPAQTLFATDCDEQQRDRESEQHGRPADPPDGRQQQRDQARTGCARDAEGEQVPGRERQAGLLEHPLQRV